MNDLEKTWGKFPVAASVIAFVLTMPLLWGMAMPVLDNLPVYWSGAAKYLLTLIATVLLCFGVFGKIPFSLVCKDFWRGLLTSGSVGMICAIMALIFSYQTPDGIPSFGTITGFTLYSFAIAVSEEFLFRGLIFGRLLESWRDKKRFVWMAVLISSVIFGLRHLLNLIEKPGTFNMTAAQVCFTLMAGIYLCAVYLKTDNLWICVLIHFLEDFFTGFWGMASSTAYQAQFKDIPLTNAVMLAGVHVIYIIFGALMLKDNHIYGGIEKT